MRVRRHLRVHTNMAHTRQSRPWLSGESLQNVSSCSLFARERKGTHHPGVYITPCVTSCSKFKRACQKDVTACLRSGVSDRLSKRPGAMRSTRTSLTSLLTSDDTWEAHSFLESDQYYPNTAAPGGGLTPFQTSSPPAPPLA